MAPTHLLREPWEGAEPRRDCKRHDCPGENVPDIADVTCERCLEHHRDREAYAWKMWESSAVAHELADGVESEDGYDIWHERAADVCLASHEDVSVYLPGTHERVTLRIEWYCKLSPIPARFRNHGWNVKTCYRLQGMGGYNHSDQWAPMDTDPHMLAHMVMRDRRALCEALQAGYRLAGDAVPV